MQISDIYFRNRLALCGRLEYLVINKKCIFQQIIILINFWLKPWFDTTAACRLLKSLTLNTSSAFTGTGFATCNIKESAADSDADLDVDGDDTLEYGKAQYTEADIIPCSGAGEDQGEAREREALRGAVLKYELTRTYAKWFILI